MSPTPRLIQYIEVFWHVDVAVQFILPILVGFVLGHYIDGAQHTTPLWTLSLGILGLFMGFGGLAKRALMERDKLAARQSHGTGEAGPELVKPAVPTVDSVMGTEVGTEADQVMKEAMEDEAAPSMRQMIFGPDDD
ncbi:MAG: AtpZ/AtpI family protein [Cyanobacteria bacterium HKST-UBA06]|nr:AtpZ/AtpI family protein [Cyanobacteria bacterium HKST-UBA04]MCA9806489.1 AtpZ/AtpI family protein [Cyanobacteria bacterium HKST-UBA06]